MDYARKMQYSDFFAQLQSAQDLLAERLGVCLVVVDAGGKEITLPSGLPLVCNEHNDCLGCHAGLISQITPDQDHVLGVCPNDLHLAALETSIHTDDGSLYLLAGRTTDRTRTASQVDLLRAIYHLPFDTPFPVRRTPPPKGLVAAQALLTAQENKVLGCIVAGLPNKDIAHRLCISQSTVKAQVANILKKLSLSNRTEASVYALKNGISLDHDHE